MYSKQILREIKATFLRLFFSDLLLRMFLNFQKYNAFQVSNVGFFLSVTWAVKSIILLLFVVFSVSVSETQGSNGVS